ncbi:hypothetical protein ACFWE5_00075 [Cellulosimicrobium funkei]|uniref:hypothetical protein n=1 Tax=Cellulosimicrobium funkei TaxID=264251 RepID=UPI00365D18B5
MNIARATRQLLAAHIAESAAWPSDETIRVSKRMRALGKQIESYKRLHEDYSVVTSDTRLRTALRFAWRHPRSGILHMRELLLQKAAADFDKLARQESVKSLLVYTVRHPVVSLTKVLPHVRFTRSSSSSRDNSPNLSQSEEMPEAHAAVEATEDNLDESLRMVREAERLLIDIQKISLMERHLDTQLFGGPERDENRFVRVSLRNSYHDIMVPGSEHPQSVVFEPRLLLHQSGAAQLNIRIESDSALTVDEILSLIWSENEIVLRSSYAAPWFKGSPWEPYVEWLDEEDAGEPVGLLNYDEPVSLRAVFFDHLAAVERTIHRTHDAWTIYPITMLRPGGCCSDERFKTRHAAQLAQIAYRAPSAVAEHVVRPKDLSMNPEASLYASLGNATHIRWQGPPPAAINELSTTLILEYALLMQMRLEAMERSLTRPVHSGAALRERYDEAIRIFAELRHGSLRSGEARDIARYLLSEYRAEETRRTIEVALELEASAHSTRRADVAARRSWRLALLGTLVAVLVAVPPLTELLTSVAVLPEGAVAQWLEWPVKVLQRAAGLGFWGPWAVLGILVGVVFVASVASGVVRLASVRLPPLRRGYVWPGTIQVMAEARDATEVETPLEDELEHRS